MFTVPTINFHMTFTLPSLPRLPKLPKLPKLQIRRRVQRALIRVILAALFIARAEIRAINVQGMLLSWFRFCPEFRDQATTGKSEWSSASPGGSAGNSSGGSAEEGHGRPFMGSRV
ncbi:hypothetical protein BZA05DRAFT_416744 [Tricharina praecox]|uniref:uncharacterized protein n=1 Tax=Tricharina praecox TaxID=43433 RepID=UPI002220D5BC|nr:uncharacterized protein BZA05DRAFT_416744 [Tricharina praecox]KAI5855151.1 hypothetical protein BZA05DRAFT_416744 [Tricharina praecox]